VVNIYSIKEILEASNKILESTNDSINGPSENISLKDIKVLENKKDFNALTDKPSTLKITDSRKDIPEVLERIILKAERSQLNTNKSINDETNRKEKKNL